MTTITDTSSTELIAIGTPAYQRLSIAMTMAGFSTFSLLYSAQPLLPEFASNFDLTAEAASLAVSVATGAMAIGILVAGAISGKVGPRPLMIFGLLSAAVFGLLTAVAPSWSLLLFFRCLSGISLSGVAAISMVYISDEVEPTAIGPAMGLYIAGSAAGGMIGRLGVAMIAGWLGWRSALGLMGVFSLGAALVFWACAPKSKTFVPESMTLASFVRGYRAVAFDPALALLYLSGFLMMGVLVTIFNFVPFHLIAPPYSLGSTAIGAIFLIYILGSFSSAWFGALAGRIGVRPAFWRPMAVLVLGVGLMAASPLWLIIAGMGVITVGFFGGHTIASSWVSRRAFGNRAYASALYLFCYYAGSSVLGSVGGIVWTQTSWSGLLAFVGGTSILALVVSVAVARIPPLSDPRQPKIGQRLPG
ncbi:MFS transporter [Rhizobium leguminosarum]|uniref:MFS transporter n=1 Tax=Rhizobium leguminosarum TaxID=384 RepID=UPI003F9C5A76